MWPGWPAFSKGLEQAFLLWSNVWLGVWPHLSNKTLDCRLLLKHPLSTVWEFFYNSFSTTRLLKLVVFPSQPNHPPIKFGLARVQVCKCSITNPNKFTQATAPASNLANVVPPATSDRLNCSHPQFLHMAHRVGFSLFIVWIQIFPNLGLLTTDTDEASGPIVTHSLTSASQQRRRLAFLHCLLSIFALSRSSC